MHAYYEGERETREVVDVDDRRCVLCFSGEVVDVDGLDSDKGDYDDYDKAYGVCWEWGNVLSFFIQEFFSVSMELIFLNIRDGRHCRDRFGRLRRVFLNDNFLNDKNNNKNNL